MMKIALALLALSFPARSFGQGCVATGASGLMVGGAEHASCMFDGDSAMTPAASASAGPYLAPGRWQAALGYRWFTSHRHFVGSKEQHEREERGNEVINHNTLLDLGVTRGISERWRLSVGLPFFIASRWQAISNAGAVIGRNVTRAQSPGDLRIVADAWLGQPSKHPQRNVSVGLGLKFPTGA